MKISIFLSLFCLFALELKAQCNEPFPPSEVCQNAPVICDLDGYCSSTGTLNTTDFPQPFCGNLENNHWLAFTAGSTSLSLYIVVSDCSNSFGLQGQIYATNDCENFTAVSNCWSPAYVTDGTINATGLSVGETYYLMFDGWSTAQCDYTILVLSGTTGVDLVADAGEDSEICEGSSLVLNGLESSIGSNYSYEWTTENGHIVSDAQTLSPTVDAAGIYTLTVTDLLYGCTKTAEVEIGAVLLPSINIEPPQFLTCNQTEITLEATISFFDSIFIFSWLTENGHISSGENSLTPSVDQAGIYQLTISNPTNGCSITSMIEVETDTSLPDVQASNEPIVCNMEDVQLYAISSTDNVLWHWAGPNNFSSTEQQPLVSQSGIYTLTATAPNGCEASTSLNIDIDNSPPEIQLSASALSCILPSTIIQIEGQAAIYQWTGPNDFQSFLPEPMVSEPGVYVLEASTETGCSATFQIEVIGDTNPPTAIAGTERYLDCGQPSVTLDGSGSSFGVAFTYQWFTPDGSILDGQQTLKPLVDKGGIYILEVVNQNNGCVATDTVVVHEAAEILRYALFSIEKPSCYDSADALLSIDSVAGGVPPLTFSLNNAAFEEKMVFDNLAAGSYDLVVKDAQGCEWATGLEIPAPFRWTVHLGNDRAIEETGAFRMSPELSVLEYPLIDIQWSPAEGLSCADCLNPLVLPARTTTYTLSLTNANGCTITDDIKITVGPGQSVYVPNAFSPNGDGYNDVFTVYGGHGVQQIVSLTILDYYGRPVFQKFNFPPNQESSGWDGVFKGKKLNSATFVYTAEIEMTDGSIEILRGNFLLAR